jgi:GT2 family glycosyltransferase
VLGKFLFTGDNKLYIRGVTYGTFRLDATGAEEHCPETVERDFAQMAANGINAVRTYTVPPRWLLDAAQRHGLWVMVGLPWEQHITFLDDRARMDSIEARVRAGVRACAGHPALLCYTIGNEIPSPIVRWYGHRPVERFLHRLYRAAKAEDPHGLVTYVNYPSTEYLDLRFVDFFCFNVYLEAQERLEAYLARLQHIAGDRPLVMAEIGLDSRRNGQAQQAELLRWQISSVFGAGCAGMFVFAWTDEWHRGGHEIDDWDFGLTDRARQPKQALQSVREAFAAVPFPDDLACPRISVVVCSYNGARTIRDCCEGLMRLNYPNYEVIVVSDGSTDATAEIAEEYPFTVIRTANRGLSSARNTGMEAAAGEIIAYTDDDARPDPDWLRYLAATFMHSDFAGVGGPNLAPAGDGWIADCVANAPGGPVHVLLSDREAEHIPGCNMAFRRSALKAIGGFDPQYRVAGDDVDVCWRIQQHGWKIGFSPAAQVWHHRRNSLRTYWRQQRGYGKAEALLEQKWPTKYNAVGHLNWAGRIYGKGLTLGWRRGRIYQGAWGSAPFQSIYQPAAGPISSLPLMPEWYLVIIALAVGAALGLVWTPLLLALPLLLLALGTSLIQAALSAQHASFTSETRTRWQRLRLRSLTALLHLLQPLARLYGRLRYGLTPWRQRGQSGLALPAPRSAQVWREEWRALEDWLHGIEVSLQQDGAVVLRGGDFDRWDLEAQGGVLGGVRLRMTIEEHGGGRQLARLRAWPRCAGWGLALAALLTLLTALAALSAAWSAAIMLGLIAALLTLRIAQECATAMSAVLCALHECDDTAQTAPHPAPALLEQREIGGA